LWAEYSDSTIGAKIAPTGHLEITESNLLRLNTFGRLFLERDGQRMSGAASQPRRLALLALLAASGDQGMTRDRLIGMLWSEADEERARKGLNQALYALRQEMGADEVFLGTRDVRLNPDLVTSDVALFTAALKAGHPERAAAEYCGPFLDGFHLSEAAEFERWLEEERAGLARDHATALERLARRAAEREERLDCAEWWRRLAAQDPLNARVAMGLMEALVAAGDRTAALQHARVYEVLLQQELEAPPDLAVVALADRIRAQMAGAATERPAASADLPSEATPPAPPVNLQPDPGASQDDAVPAPRTLSPPFADAEPPARSTAPVAGAAAFRPTTADEADVPASRALRSPRLWVLAGIAALVAAGATALLRPAAPHGFHAGRITRLTAQPGLELHPVLSPDGKFVAYAAGPSGRLRIYVRQIAGGRTIAVADSTPGDQHWPRWSPDGSRLSFEAGRAVYVVPALGGPTRLLVAPPDVSPGVNGEGAISDEGPSYLAWSPDGRKIVYAEGRRIEVRAAEGGPSTTLAEVEQPHSFAWSPDGSRIAYVLGNAAFVYAPNAIGNIAPSAIWTVSASGGSPKPLTDAASLNTSPVWLPDGRSLLFISSRDGSRDVYRVGIDRSGTSTGPPTRLTTGLSLHTIDLSHDGGQLVYADFTEYANLATLPIPAAGPVSAATAEPLTSGHQSIEGMAVSPDGRWLAFDSDRGGHQAIYLMPRTGGEPELLSPDSGDDFMPAWSPDGRELAYYGFRGGRRRLFVIPAIGGTASPVVGSDSGNQRFPDWSPDGRRLVYHSDRSGRFELYTVERSSGGRWNTPRQLTADGGQDARWSPDGRAIAYLRNGGLWVIAPDGGAPRLLVDSRDPAVRPVPLLAQWAPDGRALYYKALDAEGGASLWSVPTEGGESRLLVRFDAAARPSPRAEFAVDGRRFYFTLAERESDIWQMTLEGPS
jgi:Tol biopolymer transport system component/DNA-binding SARP family transcriptional activator